MPITKLAFTPKLLCACLEAITETMERQMFATQKGWEWKPDIDKVVAEATPLVRLIPGFEDDPRPIEKYVRCLTRQLSGILEINNSIELWLEEDGKIHA